MGWPFGGKKQDKAQSSGEPSKTSESPTSSSQPSPEAAETRRQILPDSTEKAETAQDEPDIPMPAIFEFGGPATVAGIQMKGICAADDPDQIKACLWRVDPVPKDAPKEDSKYQILF